MSKTRIIKPIIIQDSIDDKRVEIALTYDPESDTEEIVSYANFCTTIDHGTHVIGFKYGLSNALTKLTKEQMSEKELKKLDITSDDVKSGLRAVVNFDHRNPEFVGQVKERLSNADAIAYVRDATYKGLMKFFKDNPKELKIITDYVKTVAKLREEANKARKNTIRSSDLNIFSDNHPKEYIPAAGRKNLELFIIEGESAKGSGKLGREQDYQALFSLFGVPANTYEMSLHKILENQSLRDLITVLGCNIGKDFDMEKLRFEKIIILSDSDTDGNKITALLAGFFLKHLPKIVEAGRLYKAVPPLYAIGKGKSNNTTYTYLTDKRSYIEYLEKSISKNNEVYFDGRKLFDKELKDLLYKNRRYLERLTNLSDRIVINPTLLEYILLYKNKSDKIGSIKEYLSKNQKFRFLNIEYNKSNIIRIKGLVDKESQTLLLDEAFWDKSKKIYNFIHDINKGQIFYKVNGQNVTLGEMMKFFDSYSPPYIQRFKGLGEMNGEELGETTMNPKNRILYRLTVKDLKKSIDDFSILQSTKALEERKNLIRSFEIELEDLDN
jgi:DNA gyrase subunit B